MTPELTQAVTSGTSPWIWLIVIALAAGAAWYFLVHKRGKDAAFNSEASKIGSTIVADLTAAINKAHTIIASHAQTIQAQATVIASPPVQAVINAPPTPAKVLADMAGGTLPQGWVVAHAPEPDAAPKAPYDAAAILAAREYRVASSIWGFNHPRTQAYIASLSAFPHWSDILHYVGNGGAGFDPEADAALFQQFQTEK